MVSLNEYFRISIKIQNSHGILNSKISNSKKCQNDHDILDGDARRNMGLYSFSVAFRWTFLDYFLKKYRQNRRGSVFYPLYNIQIKDISSATIPIYILYVILRKLYFELYIKETYISKCIEALKVRVLHSFRTSCSAVST